MALTVVIVTGVSIVGVIATWLMFAPVINELYQVHIPASEAEGPLQNAFKSAVVMPVLIILGIIAWAVMSIAKRDHSAWGE